MRELFKIGEMEIYWLEGGLFEVDGGSMFGVVPKVLWQEKCPAIEGNYVRLADYAILVKTPDGNVLIDTGIGNKLTARQQELFRVRRPWDIPAELASLGLGRDDIDYVIMTHGDFDHAGGIVMQNEQGACELTFPQARHYMQRQEWEDVLSPNHRSASSYWSDNFTGLCEGENLTLVDGQVEIVPGVRLLHTGGHTRGHQVVWLSSGGVTALHMGDLLPMPAYGNPLWITAYDNFPLDSIAAKEALLTQTQDKQSWLLFYHDPEILACRFDAEGEVVEVFP